MGRGMQLGITITIGMAFGLVDVLVTTAALPTPAATALRVAAVLVFIGVQVAMRRGAPADGGAANAVPPTRFGRGYWAVVAVEVAALVVGVQVLAGVFDVPDAGVAWVSLVVGVHFVALAMVWREPSLHVLAAGLSLCGVVGLALAFTGASSAAVATVGGVVPGSWLLGGGVAAASAARRTSASAPA